MRQFSTMLGAFLIVASMLSAAQATLIVGHEGSNDPTTEGFVLHQGGSGISAAPVAGPPAAWQIGGGPISDDLYYDASANVSAMALGNFTDPSGWTWTGQWRLTMDNTNPGGAYTVIRDGHTMIMVNMCSPSFAGQIAPLNGGGVFVLSANTGFNIREFGTVDLSRDFHTYQIYRNPAQAGTGSEYEMYLDGNAVGTFASSDAYQEDLIAGQYWWGDGTGSAGTTAQWATNRLEIGRQIVSPVPEPSSLALLTAGLVGLLCYAWRKQK
jgi:hypothetical protein